MKTASYCIYELIFGRTAQYKWNIFFPLAKLTPEMPFLQEN